MLGLAQLVYLAPVLLVYGCFFIFAIGSMGLANAASTRQQSRDIGALFGVGTVAVMCLVALMALAIDGLLSPGVYRRFHPRHVCLML
jgi:ABC-type transport system involved in cytochrome c biogenesis permease subunit